MESAELPQEYKESLASQCARYNPAELQQNVKRLFYGFVSGFPGKQYSDTGAELAW
jgi:hypothetical protein